jgi:hypothetical protein
LILLSSGAALSQHAASTILSRFYMFYLFSLSTTPTTVALWPLGLNLSFS